MTRKIKATYGSPETVDNVLDDLLSTGIPREKIFTDKEENRVEVFIPETSTPEIDEILRRHHPEKVE